MKKTEEIQKFTDKKLADLGVAPLNFGNASKTGRIEYESQYLALDIKKIIERYKKESNRELEEAAKRVKWLMQANQLLMKAVEREIAIEFDELVIEEGEEQQWRIQTPLIFGNFKMDEDERQEKFVKKMKKLGYEKIVLTILNNSVDSESDKHGKLEILLEELEEKESEYTIIMKNELSQKIEQIIDEANALLTKTK